MSKFYKVNLYSENHDLNIYDTKIIAKKGLLYSKEIMTNSKFMICDNKTQGSFYDYYVLSTDFCDANVARIDDVKKYIDEFELNKFPVYTMLEVKKIKKLINFNRK